MATADHPTDLMGAAMGSTEQKILGIYDELKILVVQPDLPPCAARGLRKALASMWNVVNDLDLEFEQLYDIGV
jgi:hypothetical protein